MESLFSESEQLQPWWRGRSWRFWLTVLSPLLMMGGGLSPALRFRTILRRRRCGRPSISCHSQSGRAGEILHGRTRQNGGCQMPAGALTVFPNASTSGTSVQLGYRLRCAQGALEETMVYVDAGDGLRLAGYVAASPALVTSR